MDTNTFYAVTAATCFTLVGLWWSVVKSKPEWLKSEATRRQAEGVYASFLIPGLMSLAAPYIKTNALWPLIIVHMLVDFSQKLAKGFGHTGVVYSNIEMAIYLLGSIVIAGYAFWLLRHKDPVTPLAKATA